MVRVESKLPQFRKQTEEKMDKGLSLLATRIETEAKMKAPKSAGVKQGGKRGAIPGQLKSSGITKRLIPKHYQVRFGDNNSGAYARFQEYGGDGRRVVKRYSTPGTGKEFLQKAGENAQKNMISIIKGVL